MARKEGSTQSLTLQAIKASGETTVKALQETLGLDGEKGYARVSRATQDLRKAGYIEKTAPATYRYVGTPLDLKYSKGQIRMMRLIRIRTKRGEPFTARLLSELADVSLDWSKRFVQFQVRQGFLYREGTTRVGPSRVPTPVYLGSPEKMNDEWPVMRRWKRTAGLDNQAARLREAAFSLGRDVRGTRKSLLSAADRLDQLAREVRESLISD